MHNKLVAAMVVAICAVSAVPAWSQVTSSVWSGVYTDAQAQRGSTKYLQCAMCHGASLEGNGEAPPLVGRMIPDWAGTTLADLFEKIQTTMPLYRPASLSDGDTADILAFILKSNNFPTGANELPAGADALKTISFDTAPPHAAVKGTKSKPAK